MIYGGQGQNDPDFAKGVVDSLGAFVTSNQWLVHILTKQLQKKSLLVEHLQNDMQHIKHTSISKMNFDMEQIRLGYQQHMKQL